MTMLVSPGLPRRGRSARCETSADRYSKCTPAGMSESGTVWPLVAFFGTQFGLPPELFLGILSTASGSARSISGRAIRSINGAVVNAETLSLLRGHFDLSGQTFTVA